MAFIVHSALTLVVLLAVALSMVCPAADAQPSYSGSYCGTTANNVLTLNFTFPAPSGYFGNATFSMIDFGSETFPLCPSEPYQFTPANAGPNATGPVQLGLIEFSGMTSGSADCMAFQLQLMWITGFSINAYGLTFSSPDVDYMVLVAGAYSMNLNRC